MNVPRVAPDAAITPATSAEKLLRCSIQVWVGYDIRGYMGRGSWAICSWVDLGTTCRLVIPDSEALNAGVAESSRKVVRPAWFICACNEPGDPWKPASFIYGRGRPPPFRSSVREDNGRLLSPLGWSDFHDMAIRAESVVISLHKTVLDGDGRIAVCAVGNCRVDQAATKAGRRSC